MITNSSLMSFDIRPNAHQLCCFVYLCGMQLDENGYHKIILMVLKGKNFIFMLPNIVRN